jgi:hypothetical protein
MKLRPAYITVEYAGQAPHEIGSVLSKELKCFELAGASFSVWVNSNSAADASPAGTRESCGRVLTVTGMGSEWIKLSLNGFPGTPVGCPWSITSKRGQGPLPTIPPRPDVVEKDFVVLPAVASFAAARRLAGTAARRLGLKLDLRGARPDADEGLTFSRRTCEANKWSFPCYVARGRFDDGAYVSIDVAGRFFEAEDQGYLVILGSGPKNDPSVRVVAEKARALFPAAEVRTDDVYEGCIH